MGEDAAGDREEIGPPTLAEFGIFAQRRKGRQGKKIINPKHEIRNSKQFQMTRKKHQNVPNNPDPDLSF